MPELDSHLHDPRGYLDRMELGLPNKVESLSMYIPAWTRSILDVGCANGAITSALADRFPGASVRGIDQNTAFAEQANYDRVSDSLEFESASLEDLRKRGDTYETIVFASVFHEIFFYGGKMAGVNDALHDAYAMLPPGGRIIIRDMAFSQKRKDDTSFEVQSIIWKIKQKQSLAEKVAEFESYHGTLRSLDQANHFLLKYMYDDNWERECKEDYTSVSTEFYQSFARGVGANVLPINTFCIPFLRRTWEKDFNFSHEELRKLKSTSVIVIEKPSL